MLKWSHETIDRCNAEADRLIARRLRRDPTLLREARRNLNRWMAREGKDISPVYQEWAEVLGRLSRAELADFLALGTAKARRLRQSSPFIGLLTQRERRLVERIHEEARD